MQTKFRTGQLVPCSYLLEAIPRHALVQAIVRHVTDDRPLVDGQPIVSQHAHGDTRFHLLTTEDRTKTLIRLDEARVRLGCSCCDRQDHDGITAEQLAACVADGWSDITEVQSYEASMVTYDQAEDAPAGHDVTAWQTHLGCCPDCLED